MNVLICIWFASVTANGLLSGAAVEEQCAKSAEALDCRNGDLTGVDFRGLRLPAVVRMDRAKGVDPHTWACGALMEMESISVIGTGVPCSVFQGILTRCGIQARLRCDPDLPALVAETTENITDPSLEIIFVGISYLMVALILFTLGARRYRNRRDARRLADERAATAARWANEAAAQRAKLRPRRARVVYYPPPQFRAD